MPTCFHLVCKNFYLQFNRICLICVNSSKPVIIGIVRCQETVRVQIICNHVPTKVVICARTHRNKAQLGIHILKIGNYNRRFGFFSQQRKSINRLKCCCAIQRSNAQPIVGGEYRCIGQQRLISATTSTPNTIIGITVISIYHKWRGTKSSNDNATS